MPILGIIASSVAKGNPPANTPEGFVQNSNPGETTTTRSLNFTTETYSTMVPLLEVSQAFSYMDNRTRAGYAIGTSYTTGTSAFGYGSRGIKFDFFSKTYASFAAGWTVNDAGFGGSATNQGTAGYICGAMLPTATFQDQTGVINKMPYSTDVCALIAATVSPARYPGPSGIENGTTAGYLMGGTTQNGGTVYTTINKMTYSNDTCTTLSANLVTRSSASAGASFANTSGFIFGGFNNPSDTAAIGRLTFSNETADQPANLYAAMRVNWCTTRQSDKTFMNPGTGDFGGNTRRFTFSNLTMTALGINDGYTYTSGYSNQGA